MSGVSVVETSNESEKPVSDDIVELPPFPDPSDADFDEDVSFEEKAFYKEKFKDLNSIKNEKLHCTACDRHIGCSSRKEYRMRTHPMLKTLVCDTCHKFYNSGEFEKGDDGSELYCRWCGQGGQVYCCAECPHVFCAKCVKRNFGTSKIKEIENTDDWKCFKCHPKPTWEIRAVCWALQRFCDLRSKLLLETTDLLLKEKYVRMFTQDDSSCCNKAKRKSINTKKKEEPKKDNVKDPLCLITKISPQIQVKKFASLNADQPNKVEKKSQKRALSPIPVKNKTPFLLKNTMQMQNFVKNPMSYQAIAYSPPTKKIKLSKIAPRAATSMNNMNNIPSVDKPSFMSFTPRLIRPNKPIPIVNQPSFNGAFNNLIMSQNYGDNINLSLESLTQGLDMAAIHNSQQNNDVVCTPDFPLEPLCEVSEDNDDDDIQCITPAPAVAPPKPPPLAPVSTSRTANNFDLSPDNIIQMTENDVTVNAVTGGLKFRVDPQTLSSNKMYRLPDGRIFAINSNPNMPGGYSATIVAVTENQAKSKGLTFAAKLSAVTNKKSAPPLLANSWNEAKRITRSKNIANKPLVISKLKETLELPRQCDLEVPVEWFRYNLIDAVDALDYSLSRLKKLKKEATTIYLRSRTTDEMSKLHKNLERLLNTSATRFNEVKECLNRGMKQYLLKKVGDSVNSDDDDDDDDVEILNVTEDPIFIDENSLDSNPKDNADIDLVSSDLNDSAENENNKAEQNDTTNGHDEVMEIIEQVNKYQKEHDSPDLSEPVVQIEESAEILSIKAVDSLNDSTSKTKEKDETIKQVPESMDVDKNEELKSSVIDEHCNGSDNVNELNKDDESNISLNKSESDEEDKTAEKSNENSVSKSTSSKESSNQRLDDDIKAEGDRDDQKEADGETKVVEKETIKETKKEESEEKAKSDTNTDSSNEKVLLSDNTKGETVESSSNVNDITDEMIDNLLNDDTGGDIDNTEDVNDVVI